MTTPTYDEGKVYLKDIRSGAIYPYEKYLALDKNFTAVVPNPVAAPAPAHQESEENAPSNVTLNLTEHAAPSPG